MLDLAEDRSGKILITQVHQCAIYPCLINPLVQIEFEIVTVSLVWVLLLTFNFFFLLFGKLRKFAISDHVSLKGIDTCTCQVTYPLLAMEFRKLNRIVQH